MRAVGTEDRRSPALLRAVRPKQWIKNVLVAAAPLAAGSLFDTQYRFKVAIAFVAFCLASGAGYLVNDLVDVEADRQHLTKRTRPIASGEISARSALVVAVLLAVASVGGGWVLGAPRLALVLAVYLAVTVTYSLGLKNQPVFELAAVASGFVLRAIAGAAVTGLPLSQWFLLVASFGSLFMVAGKRSAELMAASVNGAAARPSVTMYSPSYLNFVWSVSAAGAIFAYALWSFDVGATSGQVSWAQVSVAPFVLAVLRYAVDVDRGRASSPEDVVLRDRGLQVLGLVWLVTFVLAANGV